MRSATKLLICTALTGAALGGCGSSSTPSVSASPTRIEASYFPATAPLVMTIATDPNSPAIKGIEALVQKFPLAALGLTAATSRLSQLGIDLNADLRPLFGNPISLGATSASARGSGPAFLGVWITRDSGKLASLINRLPGIRHRGSHAGAELYTRGGSLALAVSGTTLLIATNVRALDDALDRHARGAGGAPAPGAVAPGAAVSLYGDLSSLLARPNAAKARRIPWIAALKSYSAAIGASQAGLSFAFHLDTSGVPLSAAQVPLATGTGAPRFAGRLPITVSVLDPAQILNFAEAVEQITAPAAYAKFLSREATERAKTGVDLGSAFRLLSGDLIVASDTHTTLARVGVSDPRRAASDLAKLVAAPGSVLFSDPTTVTDLGGGFYRLDENKATVTIGVTGNQIALGEIRHGSGPSPTVAQVRAFASAPTTRAPGARGTVAFRVSIPALLRIALKRQPPQILNSVLSTLGDLTGWTSASPSGVDGQAALSVG